MVQEKPCGRLLPCYRSKHRIAASVPHALHCVSSLGGSDCVNDPAVFLDGCHSWSPKAERFRAHLLFPLPRACFFLWRLAAGPQCATLLHNDPGIVGDIYLDGPVFGALVFALAAGAFACRIRANPRIAPRTRKEHVADRRLRPRRIFAALVVRRFTVVESARSCAAEQFLGLAFSGLAGGQLVRLIEPAMAVRESCPRRPTKVLSPN